MLEDADRGVAAALAPGRAREAIISAASASGSPGAGAEEDAPRRERAWRARRDRARAPRRGADASDTQDIAARAPHRLPRPGERASSLLLFAARRAITCDEM